MAQWVWLIGSEELPKECMGELRHFVKLYEYLNDSYVSGDSFIGDPMLYPYMRAYMEQLGIEPSKIMFNYYW